MSILIGLSGFAGSGKDSLGKMLVDRDDFTRISFADKVRDYALAVNPTVNADHFKYVPVKLSELVEDIGWEAAKRDFPEVREFLIGVGHGARMVFDYDFWVNIALPRSMVEMNSYGQSGILPAKVVVTDVRYMNEVDRVKDLGGIHIRIVREGVVAPFDHATEKELPSDYTIENQNGNMEIMYNQVKGILDGLSWDSTNTARKTMS